MSANNFENNVQQKLDELRLRPAEQVWLEVERRIREKKRRRIIFWFLLPGLLLLGGVTWLMLSQSSEKNDIVAIETIEKNKIESRDQIENNELEKPVTVKKENTLEVKSTNESKPEETIIPGEKKNNVYIGEPTAEPVQLINKRPGKLITKRAVTEIQKTDLVVQKPRQDYTNTNLDNSVKTAEDITKTNDKISKSEIPVQLA